MKVIPTFKIGTFSLLGTFNFAKDPLYFIGKGFATCGDTFRLKLLREFIVTRDPAFFRHVLQQNNKNYLKGRSSDALQLVLGQGLLTSEGDFWRHQRRLIQPAFHRERLEELFQTMGNITAEFLKELNASRGKGPVDIDQKMMGLTADIAMKTLFSNISNEDITSLYRQINRTQKYLVNRLRRPYRIPLMAVNGEKRRFNTDLVFFNKLIFEIIQNRKESGIGQNDLLQLLLDSRDEETNSPMNDQQIRDEAITMFSAGHETSATGLTWLLFELAKQPEMVAKIRKEAGIFEHVPTFSQLMQLPYTRQVVEEGLRLFPPAWTITRTSIDDDEIEGHFIDKGTSIFLSVFELHRHPELWQDPLVFNPDNFSAENIKNRPKFAYVPFGAGPRLCIGHQFALMEMQLILAAVVKHFDFDVDSSHKVSMYPQIVLKPANGIRLFVK